MAHNVEMDFGEPAGDAEADVLDGDRPPRRTRVPDSVWIAAGAAFIVVALIVDLARGHGSSPSPSPSSSQSSAPTESSLLQQQMTEVALAPARLADNVRATDSGCPSPHGGTSPIPAQQETIHRWFSQFAQFEVSQTIDAAEGLCSITIRGHDELGSILVVMIAAPPNPTMVEFDVTNYGESGAYPVFIGADFVSSTGFRTQVGVLGNGSERFTAGSPTAQLAEDSGLTW